MDTQAFWNTILITSGFLSSLYLIPYLIHKGWLDAKSEVRRIKLDEKSTEQLINFLKDIKK